MTHTFRRVGLRILDTPRSPAGPNQEPFSVREGRYSMLRLVVFLSLFALPLSAAAQSPDDKLVVPGIRIGSWRLDMTVDELIKLHGPETSRGPVRFPDMVQEFTFVRWPTLGIGVDTLDGRNVDLLVLGIGGVPILHKTAEGIGFQSTAADVVKVYGPPTAETVPRDGQRNLIFDELGINFQVFVNGRVNELRIFKPRTAGSIWKF